MKLGCLCETIFSGGTPNTSNADYWNGEFHWLSSGETRNTYIFNTEKTITQKGIDNSSTRLAKKNDVVIASAGQGKTRGQVSYCMIDTYINQSLISMRADPKLLDPKFLFYNLTSRYNELRTLSDSSSSRGSLTIPILENIDILLPPLKQQKTIATILSNYDDLVENNSKRIKILEDIAQKIYKEWFVDFKYPGHETATFKDTELGRIPSDWEVKTLKDTIDSIKETIKPGEHLKNLRYVPIDCIPRKSFFLTTSESYKNAQSSLILFKKSDILFGNMRSYFHKVILAPFDGITRTTCFVLRPKVDNYRSWAFLTMFQDSTVAYSSRNSKGATIPYSFWEDGLAEMKVIFPSTKIIKAFNDIINPMLENIQQGYFKQENLKQTRDLLLPRLISGEIDVENLEIK